MAGRLENYPEDHVIIKEGVKNNRMFVVLEGSVALYMNYGKKNEYVLGVCGKNKIFGEMSMLSKEESDYTAVAFTDAKVAWFQENNLNQFLAGYPNCAADFLKNIAKNNALMRKHMTLLMNEVDTLSEKISQLDNGSENTDSKETVGKDADSKETVSRNTAKLGIPGLYAADDPVKGGYRFNKRV